MLHSPSEECPGLHIGFVRASGSDILSRLVLLCLQSLFPKKRRDPSVAWSWKLVFFIA